MFKWKPAKLIGGETMRESGILIGVFIPLDAAFSQQRGRLHQEHCERQRKD
ncbi:MAG TPA: hypothetical protein VEU08_01930 [Vicinamibacterales bacterium]|nr:hypothetical protein [Vicinamibacterales bacterium]